MCTESTGPGQRLAAERAREIDFRKAAPALSFHASISHAHSARVSTRQSRLQPRQCKHCQKIGQTSIGRSFILGNACIKELEPHGSRRAGSIARSGASAVICVETQHLPEHHGCTRVEQARDNADQGAQACLALPRLSPPRHRSSNEKFPTRVRAPLGKTQRSEASSARACFLHSRRDNGTPGRLPRGQSRSWS